MYSTGKKYYLQSCNYWEANLRESNTNLTAPKPVLDLLLIFSVYIHGERCATQVNQPVLMKENYFN